MAEINKEADTDVDLVYEALEQLRKIMAFDNNGTTSRLVEYFKFCAGVEKSSASPIPSVTDTSAPLSSTIEQDETEDDQHPWLNVTSLEECNAAYRKLRNHINDVIIGPYGHIQGDQEFCFIGEQ